MLGKQQILLVCVCVALLSGSALAAPPAEEIFRRMHMADSEVSFAGEQIAYIVRGGTERKVRRRVMHQAPNLLRVEHLFPASLKGELIVADGQNRWHYFPSRKEAIKIPQYSPARKRFLLGHRKELARRNFRILYHGEDHVAGRDVYVIELKCANAGGVARKFWVDTSTFVKLKSLQTYPAAGTTESMWFERIDFHPRYDKNTFRFTPPPGTRVVGPPAPGGGRALKSLAELNENAPFPVMTPSFFPQGYVWESGAIQERGGEQVVWTRYTNGVDNISLFQRQGGGNDHDPRRGPRGTVMWQEGGYHFIAIGRLPYETMVKIANSVR